MAINTSSTVSFDSGAAGGGRSLVIEQDTDDTVTLNDGESLIRVYPALAIPKLTVVKGVSYRLFSSYQPKVVEEWVTFTGGSTSGGLSYIPSGSVLISDMRFFNEAVVATYNSDSNQVEITKAIPGILKIKYTTYYNRYVIRHEYGRCGSEIMEENTGYQPAFIVAQAVGFEDVSAEISGPACPGTFSGGSNMEFEQYELMGIKMEVDPNMKPSIYDYTFDVKYKSYGFSVQPIIISMEGESAVLYCGCKVRVYPASASVHLTVVDGAIGALSGEVGVRSVEEALSFNGGQSVSLGYPPSSSVSLTSANSAVSVWGEEIRVGFAGPGDRVKEVKWVSPHEYTVVRNSRDVREDEVVAVQDGKTVPCYSFCQANYSAEYRTVELMFAYDENTRTFKTAMLVATDDGGRIMGSMPISPPSLRGVL